jgi:enoyl-CoA hydratase/carnithine racemase
MAKCYNPELPHKAVVIIDTGESLLTFCAGADEMELAEMIGHANEMAQALTLRDAPPKEMFN